MSTSNYTIGITGGIACGKSEVSRILEHNGVPVCDADLVAHEVMEPGCSTFNDLVDAFGVGILGTEGRVDRIALGKVVFEDRDALAHLNGIVHPAVKKVICEWMDAQGGICAVAVPLLYEVGWESLVDAVLCIASSPENMIQRVMQRGFTKEESLSRIEAQMSVEEKARRADYVIRNVGSLAELEASTLNIIHRITCERIQYAGRESRESCG